MDICTITMLEELDGGSVRIFGYFTNLCDAQDSLKYNITDLHETIYEYGIIERFSEGLNPMAFERWFYRYNDIKDMYEAVEPPKLFKYQINFAMG